MMAEFEPAFDGFETRTRASFAAQAVMGTLGATIQGIAPGLVQLALPFRADLTQQHGFLHAGVVTAVLDSACGYAAFTLMPEGAEVLTIEFKSNFLSPAAGDRFEFEGRVLKPGRSVIVTEGEAWAIQGAARKMISKMSATMMVARDRPDLTASQLGG